MKEHDRRSFLKATGVAIAATAAVSANAGPKPGKGPHGRGCTLATMKGDHGYTYSGTVIGIGPIATAGLISFDGEGNLAATYIVSINGTIFEGAFTGVYTVNPNCTGTVRLDLPMMGISLNGSFVIVNNGDETFFTGNDAGYAITGSTKRVMK